MPTAPSPLEVVDGEVRELIRRRGLGPITDPGPVASRFLPLLAGEDAFRRVLIEECLVAVNDRPAVHLGGQGGVLAVA